MSIAGARRRAEELYRKLGADEVPVDVEAIADRLGVPVIYDDLGSPEISGLLISNDDGACIIIQKADHPNRQRFSVAHEIGHLVLEDQFEEGEHVHVDRGNYISRRDARSSEGVDPKEMEANGFASSLLMPEEAVRRVVREITRGGPLFDYHVGTLAGEFAVSEQAMTIRLTTLGFL